MEPSSVCVIGAGMCGLPSLKCMKDAGFLVKCFEKDKFIGGRWNSHNSNPIPRSTITNIAKPESCYSDFPMRVDFPLFISADQYTEYFQEYAENFGLLPFINLEHEVIEIEALKDFGDSKFQWRVHFKSNESNKIQTELFHYVVISSGFNTIPFVPEKVSSVVAGFSGKLIHCIDFKTGEDFKNQKVVVCGLGNSGGDVSVEVCKFAKRTFLSTSRGGYVISRLTKNGQSVSEAMGNRLHDFIPKWVISFLKSKIIQMRANTVADIEKWGLKPKSLTSIVINDEILYQIAFGKITVCKEIINTEGKTVYFKGGVVEHDVDAIIICTGYTRKFPFLDEKIFKLEKSGKFLPLYKGIFPAKENNSLAFVGMFSTFSPIAFTAELQARYAAECFLGNIKLPNPETMEESIKKRSQALINELGEDIKEMNLISDPWAYYMELSDEIGCRHSILPLLWSDPVLFWYLSTRHSFHEFRLVGPNKWSGARDAIIKSYETKLDFMKTNNDE